MEPKTVMIELALDNVHKLNNRYRMAIYQKPVPKQSEEARKNHFNSIKKALDLYGSYRLDPEAAWAEWKKNRLAEGWTYGEKYDDKNKKHPNLVKDWHLLPQDEQNKDLLHWVAIEATRMTYEQITGQHLVFDRDGNVRLYDMVKGV